ANSLNTTYNGKNQTASGFSATGLVNGETESVLSGVQHPNAKDAGSYTIKPMALIKTTIYLCRWGLILPKPKHYAIVKTITENQTASGFRQQVWSMAKKVRY
ncbi:hypothetical protein ACINWC743_A0150, partial [Acinetobacter sp. WC-743]|uniref:hypothetical protein n=1 Tax=Acinetobacter sp. WC-743 TaxID=903945 RepID=UPI0002AE97FF